MANTPTRTLALVPHTHWDREWYRPFEAYRMRLVEAIDQLLSQPWPHFLLDGQCVVLDDYLAIRPEAAPALRAAIAEGRLAVGPWFVLVDEFLVSGEALIRNLLEGRRGMATMGATASVGYLPDMFGHIAQMPQILQGFGLHQAVLWRGVAPGANRFRWVAPDGSSVEAAWLPVGYYQTALVTPKGPAARAEALLAYLEHFPTEGQAWMLAGADHMIPELAALQAATQEGLPGWQVLVMPLEAAIAGPPATLALHGELRDPSKAYLLPGVLSTRPWIKRANAQAQLHLERVAEPAAALAWAQLGRDQRLWLRQAWRQLMLNHPHDSICGCSIDQVHRDMAPRFAASEQIAEGVVAQALALPPAPPMPAPHLPLALSLGELGQGRRWVELELAWPLGRPGESPPPPPPALQLHGPDGQAWPTALLAPPERGEDFAAELSLEPDWHPVMRYRVATELPADGVGLMAAQARGVEACAPWPSPLRAGASSIENDGWRLELADGRVVLTELGSGRRWDDLVGLWEEGDLGDTYNFAPDAANPPRRASLVGASAHLEGPHRAVLALHLQLAGPVGLAPDRSGWEGELGTDFWLHLSLQPEGPVVAGELHWVQQRRDHRLRLGVGCQVGTTPKVWSDGAFGLFERSLPLASALPVPKGVEAVMPEFPLEALVVVEGEGRLLGLATRGDHEASWWASPEGPRLMLTAMRAVGWLSRDDLSTRGGGAGPRMPTPEAQCPGPQHLAFALVPGGPGGRAALQAQAEAWRVPPLAHPGALATPLALARVQANHPALRFDALKPSEAGQAMVLRAHNALDEALEGAFLSLAGPWVAEEVALDERPVAPAEAAAMGGAWRPHQIRSWRLSWLSESPAGP